MAAALQITERTSGDVTILELKGRVVLGEGDDPFRRHIEGLMKRGSMKIILNLGEVTYIDSAGVGVMVGRLVAIRKLGGDIRLLNLVQRNLRVMTITKLVSVFETFEGEDEAVRSFDAAN
jgi:anti-sigma B factor antagonist